MTYDVDITKDKTLIVLYKRSRKHHENRVAHRWDKAQAQAILRGLELLLPQMNEPCE